MELIIISIVSFSVALLTFFSGFGLGTLLLPAFALFFPLEIAVAATAIVHFANNLLKLALIGKDADKTIVIRFAFPAAFGAIIGAWLLGIFTLLDPVFEYAIYDNRFSISPIKFLIALLMIAFAIFELMPYLNKIVIDKKYISLGGLLSGFFGGLSGHQGALRTAFLLKSGLGKKPFVGTMVVSAVIVDFVRIIVYGFTFLIKDFSIGDQDNLLLLVSAGCISAFIGSFMGRCLIEKVTFEIIQKVIGILLIVFALALGAGLI